jgi:transcription antitermination factor NusG
VQRFWLRNFSAAEERPGMTLGSTISPSQLAHSVSEVKDRNWYAVYTRHSHEKTVRDAFASRNIECYLPTYSVKRRRINRCTVELSLPVFPTYIFTRIAWGEHVRLLEVPSVISIVGFGLQRPTIPETEIEALRSALKFEHTKPHPYLNSGERVRIRSGPLEGLTGIVLRMGNNLRVVLSVQLIMQSVVIDVEQSDLEFIGS